jgi:hypothetical protein
MNIATKSKTFKNNTNEILYENDNIINNILKNYYDDVLIFLNAIFNDNSNSILKIKINNVELNDNIFKAYNEIIKIHKLKYPLFKIENYDFDEEHTKDEVLEIIMIMCNNLLKRLDYSLKINKFNKKLQLIKNS